VHPVDPGGLSFGVYYGDLQEFSDAFYERYEERTGEYPNSEQDEWMEAIWNEYNEDGWIDWGEHGEDSAWYMYMTEVLGYSHEEIEKYM
jgi:hypothetical protein